MKDITILVSHLGFRTSGQSRFAINIAKGLSTSDLEIGICTLDCRPEAVKHLEEAGVELHSANVNMESNIRLAKSITRWNSIGRKLANLANEKCPSRTYLVLSDDSISCSAFLTKGKKVYISQGEPSLLFSNPSFYNKHKILKRLISLDMAHLIRMNSIYASKYDLLLANSEQTRSIISFLYGVPFGGVVYPPVDREVFYRRKGSNSNRFALALARNENEPNLDIISNLAKLVEVKVVGGGRVGSTQNCGIVTDEELARLYSESACLAFPNTNEYFGYAVAEALSCGTPVVCFSTGGPSEMVEDGKNGWQVDSSDEFIGICVKLVSGEIAVEPPAVICKNASTFSIKNVVGSLINTMSMKGLI